MSELPTNSADPVHETEGNWYFYDETWADTHGPYLTEKKAREALAEYGRYM